MLGNTAIDRSKSFANPTSLTTLLVGFILCYQVANYIFLKSALDDMNSDFNSELEASCAADAGLAGGSSLCIEAQLFRGWHEMPDDAPGSLEKLLEITPPKNSEEQSMSTSSMPMAPKPAPDEKQGADEQVPVVPNSAHQDLKPAVSMRGSSSNTQEAHQAQTHETKFTHDLVDLQKRLELKLQEQSNRHKQHRALHALSAAARGVKEETPPKQDTMTPFMHELDDMTHDIQHHMEVRKKEREEHLAARAAMHNARIAEANAKLAVEAAAPLSPTALDKQREHHSFMDEVQSIGWDLCQDPHRHDLPACAQFLKEEATHNGTDNVTNVHVSEKVKSHHESHHEANLAAMAHMHLLERHMDDLKHSQDQQTEAIRQESEHLLRDLCADPARNSYPACAQFLLPGSDTSAPTVVDEAIKTSNLRGGRDSASAPLVEKPKKNLRASMQIPVLTWDMKGWVTKHRSAALHETIDKTPFMFHRQDERLRGKWQGQIPVVACVTVLPQGQVTEELMKTFMDNYNAQEYEGERKLIIVYHMDDKKSAEIVQPYVDGKSVIAATAFGEGHFISSTAYRYGGWLAKSSDITAQWDFDAWHHPLQLSMQVRAMVISGRPASVVTWVTDYNTAGTKSSEVQGGSAQHGSMVGETSWMRKNWMPLIEEEQSVPTGLHAREVVQVDMPELLAYHDMKAHELSVHH